MKNLKKLLCGALSLTMVLGLAACGGNTATTESTDGDTAAKADGNVPVIGISQYGQHASLDNCREGFLQGLADSCVSSVGPMMIITYSYIFSYMLTRMNVANMISNFCVANITSEWVFLVFVLIITTIAGCFIDGMATMLMLLPVLSPVVTIMNIDFQHFALVYVMGLLTCQITPPVGNLIYVAASIQKTPVKKVVKSIIPFCVVMILVIFLCIFIPELVTWLPNLIYG